MVACAGIQTDSVLSARLQILRIYIREDGRLVIEFKTHAKFRGKVRAVSHSAFYEETFWAKRKVERSQQLTAKWRINILLHVCVHTQNAYWLFVTPFENKWQAACQVTLSPSEAISWDWEQSLTLHNPTPRVSDFGPMISSAYSCFLHRAPSVFSICLYISLSSICLYKRKNPIKIHMSHFGGYICLVSFNLAQSLQLHVNLITLLKLKF